MALVADQSRCRELNVGRNGAPGGKVGSPEVIARWRELCVDAERERGSWRLPRHYLANQVRHCRGVTLPERSVPGAFCLPSWANSYCRRVARLGLRRSSTFSVGLA